MLAAQQIITTTPSSVVGANVRAEMARRGRSQTWLAQVLGLSQTAINRRLHGRTLWAIDELVTVAAQLGVPLEVLTDGVAA